MGVGIGGGGFGLSGGVSASSKGAGFGVGVGPFKATSGCAPPSGCVGYFAFMLGLTLALIALAYLGPIVILVWAARRIYLARKQDQPLAPRTLGGLIAVVVVSAVFSVWIWGYTIDEMSHSKDLPSIHTATITEAQHELELAGFTNTIVDYGNIPEAERAASCVVSDTTPKPYEHVDTRDEVILHISYCP